MPLLKAGALFVIVALGYIIVKKFLRDIPLINIENCLRG